MASQTSFSSSQINLKWLYRMFIALLIFLLAAWFVWLYFSKAEQEVIPSTTSQIFFLKTLNC